MTLSTLDLLTAAASADAPFFVQYGMIIQLVGLVGIFWFLVLRPQMRAQKELRNKIAGIKKGDQVLTGGGFLAKVIKVDDNYAELELGPNVKVKALKSTISDVIPPAGSAPAND